MRKLKYIKIFEAFKSNKLTKTLKYTKSESREFLSLLRNVLRNIDFPESEISDEYFEYMPFKKALYYTKTVSTEKCIATSNQEFPDHGIDGEACKDGKIRRMWGSRQRSVTCPRCEGTGIKRERPELKLVKFWFDMDGNFITGSAFDGTVLKTSKLDDNLKNYDVVKEVEDLQSLQNGSIVLFVRNGDGKEIIGYKYDKYLIQNEIRGDTPWSFSYRNLARYSFNYIYDTISKIKLLKPKADLPVDPYSWNLSIRSRGDVVRSSCENNIKRANFALILDIDKVKKSKFDKVNDIQIRRIGLKDGAFLSNEEIKRRNIKGYISKISKSFDASNISDDLSDTKRLAEKLFRNRYALFVLLGTNNRLSGIIDSLYNFIEADGDDSQPRKMEELNYNIENSIKSSYNSNLSKNLPYVLNRIDKEFGKESTNKKLLNKMIETSELIHGVISSSKIETIEDLEVLNMKLNSIKSLFTTYNTHNLVKVANMCNHIYSRSEDQAFDTITSRYYSVGESEKNIAIKRMSVIDNIIKKL